MATQHDAVPAASDQDPKLMAALAVSNSPKQKQGCTKDYFVIVVVSFCAIGGILFGLDQSNFGGAIVKTDFEKDFCVHNFIDSPAEAVRCSSEHCTGDCTPTNGWVDFKSWGGSVIQLGAAAGALLIAPFVCRRYGRRFSLFVGSIIVSAAMLWCSLTTEVIPFYAARVLTGLGIGIITYTLPIYNSEVSPPGIRGMLGSTMQLSCVIGSQIAAGYNIPSTTSWRASLAAPVAPALILAIGIFFMPASPRMIMQNKGEEEARQALKKLRRTDNVDEELQQIMEAIQQEKDEQPYSVLFTDPSIRKRLIIANMLQWLQQFTGINAMVGYGPDVFIKLGLPLDGQTANFIAQAFNFVGTVMMMGVIDKFGRRPLLMAGAAVMFCTMGGAGVIDKVWDVDHSPAKAWLMYALLCVYFLGFAVAWGGVPWVYPSEIFPMDVKEKALSTSVFSQWMANFVIMQIVQRLIASIGIGWTFLFFAIFLLIAFFYVYFQVPETKGIPLEDMDKLFGARQYIEYDDEAAGKVAKAAIASTDSM